MYKKNNSEWTAESDGGAVVVNGNDVIVGAVGAVACKYLSPRY